MSMFRRKEDADDDIITDTETAAPAADTSSMMSAPKPAAPAMTSPVAAAMPAPMAPASAPRPMAAAAPATAPGFRPTPAAAPMGATTQGAPARPSAPSGNPAGSNAAKGGKRILTVGNDILLKGEIATCDRLVIEGSVDARLNDVHTVEIAETGSFKGTAEIEDAEISGLFEGELIVRNRLTIYATGKVRGKIAYGEIEIERGGQLTGEITIGAPIKSDKPKMA